MTVSITLERVFLGNNGSACVLRAPLPSILKSLLMDEPCSALYPITTVVIDDLIGELRKHYAIAILTHFM